MIGLSRTNNTDNTLIVHEMFLTVDVISREVHFSKAGLLPGLQVR